MDLYTYILYMDEIIVEFYQQKNYKCINIWTEEAFKQKSAHSRKTHKISKKWISVWNLLIFNKINLFLWKVVNTERLLGGSRQIYDWKTNQKVLSDLISPTKPLEKTVCSSFFRTQLLSYMAFGGWKSPLCGFYLYNSSEWKKSGLWKKTGPAGV